jgi:hypothetical protein
MDQDEEIAAMSAVAKALEPLDELVRRRVISWRQVALKHGGAPLDFASYEAYLCLN